MWMCRQCQLGFKQTCNRVTLNNIKPALKNIQPMVIEAAVQGNSTVSSNSNAKSREVKYNFELTPHWQ